METKCCASCGEELEPCAEYCNWCGDGPYRREGEDFECGSCGEAIADSFSFCPWCCEDLDGDWEPRERAKGFRFNDTCPECKGSMLRTMEFCPWCGDGQDEYEYNEAGAECEGCGRSSHYEWQHCVFCGEFLQQIVRLNEDVTVKITPDAFLALALSPTERQLESRRTWIFFEESGYETLGILFGVNWENCSEVRAVFPFATAKSKTASVDYPKNFEQIMGRIKPILKSAGIKNLEWLGTFHSHPDTDDANPSITDHETTEIGDLEIIVAVRRTSKKTKMKWNRDELQLEGSVGNLAFAIKAYSISENGVAECHRVAIGN